MTEIAQIIQSVLEAHHEENDHFDTPIDINNIAAECEQKLLNASMQQLTSLMGNNAQLEYDNSGQVVLYTGIYSEGWKINNATKEILIDLINYYNVIGTEDDPGFVPFADIVNRASKALEQHANGDTQGSGDVDPFTAYDEFPDHVIKHESDWWR